MKASSCRGSDGRSVSLPTCGPTRLACRSRRSTRCGAHRRRVRRRVRAREAELLQGQGRRPGCARSHSPDVDAVRPRVGAPVSHRRPVSRCIASSGTGSWPRRCRRRCSTKRSWTSTAGDYSFRVKGSVPKFSGWMAVYGRGERRRSRSSTRPTPRRERRDQAETTRTRRAACCHRWPKASRSSSRRFGRSRNSRSPLRASAKRRSSRSSRKTGSAGRAPTRRLSACSRTRDYVDKTEGRFKPTMLAVHHHRHPQPRLRRHPGRRVHGKDGRAAR